MTEKDIKRLLKNYKFLKMYRDNLKEELEIVREENGLKAINYDGENIQIGRKHNSIVEEVCFNRIRKENVILLEIRKIELKINLIDKAMEVLTDKERKMIELRYFEKYNITYVANYLYVSYDTAYKNLHKITKKLTECMNGND